MFPKLVGDQCLGDSIERDFRVFPRVCRVSIEETPVAIPSWSSVEGLCSIVITFTMTAKEKDFVRSAFLSTFVETFDLESKLLPLS